MKKVIMFLSILFTLTSCGFVETKEELMYVCDCQQQAAASAFIKETIEPANNMSDEEMEDVISQLEKTSVRLHCSQRYISVTRFDGRIQTINNLPKDVTVYPYY